MKRKQHSSKPDSASQDSAASLHEAALRHFQSGRYTVAEERIRRALALDSQHADSLYLSGLLRAQADNIDAAIDFVTRAVRVDQTKPDYFSALGVLLASKGQFTEALKSYNIALALKPDFASVWVRIGDLEREQKRFREALLAYDRALSIEPRNLEAADRSGELLIEMRRNADALARFEQSDAIRPGRSDTLFRKGVCFQLLARLEEAAANYTMALAADAKNHVARNNLGAALLELGKPEEAVAHLRKSIQNRPNDARALNNLGLALTRLKQLNEALSVLDRAVALDPNLAEAINNRGNVLRQLGHADEAMKDFDRSLALKPADGNVHSNRAACLDDLSRYEEAFASYKMSLMLSPDHGDAHWNFAINRLRLGDYKTGWTEAEWRWKAPSLRIHRRQWNRPLWLGSQPIAGKTVLLFNDQGLGDAIQFCRYIPQLAARGARVVLEIDEQLKELLLGLPGVAQCLVKGEALPEHDYYCPLMSLPLAFGTMVDTIPSDVPYLSTDRHHKSWQAFFGATAKPRIGVVWSGNPIHANDRNRSLPPKMLTPLFDVDAQFVSLQKNAHDGDLAFLRERGDILDAAPEIGSFADTATLIQQLDLVISVDTSVAHLAGALGRPVWVLLPYVPDYRWLLDRNDSVWYPTARLYRQTAKRDYAEVVDRVRADLLQEIVPNEQALAAD
jgi:tetratricopeptide (TPR) repeat protein